MGHDSFVWDILIYEACLTIASITIASIIACMRSHVLCICHVNELCPVWMSHVPLEWVMSHFWFMPHLLTESCPIWMSHVPYEWVMSYMNESCPMCTSHVSSAPLFARLRCSGTSIYAGDTTHFTYVMWQKTRDSLICDMTHSCVTWLIHMGHGSFIWDMIHSCVTCLIRMGHDSFIRDMTYSYGTWLTVHGTWLTCMCHRISSVGRSYDSSSMWYYSLTCDMKPLLIAVPMTDHICDITDIYVTWSVLYSSFEMWLDSLFKWDTTHLRGTWHRLCMHFIWLTVYVTWLDYTWHDIACKRKS